MAQGVDVHDGTSKALCNNSSSLPPSGVPICCSLLRRYRTMQIYLKTTPLSTNSPAKSRPNDGLSGDSLDVPLSSCSHIHTNRVAYPDLYLQLKYRIKWDLTWIKVSSCTFFTANKRL